MLFGVGILMPKSAKQKLNTKSTTESEIFGASDYIPNIIWQNYFSIIKALYFKRIILVRITKVS